MAYIPPLYLMCTALLISNFFGWTLYLQLRHELSTAGSASTWSSLNRKDTSELYGRSIAHSPPNASSFRPRGREAVLLWESFDSHLLFSDERLYKVLWESRGMGICCPTTPSLILLSPGFLYLLPSMYFLMQMSPLKGSFSPTPFPSFHP